MSTVSASIIGAYFTLIEPKYVVTAVVLNLFGGFIIASIINPYKVNEEDDKLLVEETEERQQSFFEMLGEYILDGFKVAVIVGAMLIGYIAIIALLNGIVSNIFSTVSGGAILGFPNINWFCLCTICILSRCHGKMQFKPVQLWRQNYYLTNL